MLEIPLTKGHVAIIDDEDAALAQFSWYAELDRHGNAYAARKPWVAGGGPRKKYHLHREVLGDPAGLVVDHMNGNPLDNRRQNLRAVSVAENCRNVGGATRLSKSGILGVSFILAKRRWRANIRIGGKTKQSPLFHTADEATSWRASQERLHYGIQPRRAEALRSA